MEMIPTSSLSFEQFALHIQCATLGLTDERTAQPDYNAILPHLIAIPIGKCLLQTPPRLSEESFRPIKVGKSSFG
jgi:hypothetical protein